MLKQEIFKSIVYGCLNCDLGGFEGWAVITFLPRVGLRRSPLGEATLLAREDPGGRAWFWRRRCDNVREEFEDGMRRLEGGIEHPVEGKDRDYGTEDEDSVQEVSSRSNQFIVSMSPAGASSAVAAGSAAGQAVKSKMATSRVSMVRNMPRFYLAYFGLGVMGVPPVREFSGGAGDAVGDMG